MGDTEGLYDNTTEPQEEEIVNVPKKPRSDLQRAALEAARKKAYELRAERAAKKKQEDAFKALAKVEAQKKALKVEEAPGQPAPKLPKVEVKVEDEDEEEPEVIYRKRPPKKKKRVVVVEQESSSDSEIEVRLPKAKPPIKPKTQNEIRYEKAYNRLFSVDTV